MTGSWLDVLLVLMLVTSIALGFHHGLLRQAFLLMAMYIATVMSAQYYGHISDFFVMSFPSTNRAVSDIIAFALLATLLTIAMTGLIWTSYRGSRLPTALMLDNLGGAILGSIIGLFVISLTLMLAKYAVQVQWPDGSSIKLALYTGLTNSVLQDAFSTPLPIVQSLLQPWLPPGIPFMTSG